MLMVGPWAQRRRSREFRLHPVQTAHGPTRQTQRLRQPVEQEFERLLRTIWLTPGVLVIDLSTERRAYYDRETEDLIAMGVL